MKLNKLVLGLRLKITKLSKKIGKNNEDNGGIAIFWFCLHNASQSPSTSTSQSEILKIKINDQIIITIQINIEEEGEEQQPADR